MSAFNRAPTLSKKDFYKKLWQSQLKERDNKEKRYKQFLKLQEEFK